MVKGRDQWFRRLPILSMVAIMNPIISRRTAMQATAATALVTGPARATGPLVWLDMDQKALDDAYTQSVYAPNAAQVLARYASNSDIVRARLGPPVHHTYGGTAIEGLDVFSPKREQGQAPCPVGIFIHGGAWRTGMARDYAFAAELFVNAGLHYVVPDFINVDQAGGDLTPMVDQVRRAIAWVYSNADSFGGDAGRIHLFAHSSGAHLAGVALTTDWREAFGFPGNIVKTALLCSGLYDLKPVRLSVRSTYVHFTDAMEDALSTDRHLEHFTTPVIIAHGTNETPEFKRQTEDFAATLKGRGKAVELLIGQNYNHFEMAETLASPYGVLGRAALTQAA